MKRILKSGILLAIITLALTSCCKDKPDDGTLSPPSWILGEWEWSYEDDLQYICRNYKFTSNDLISSSTHERDDMVHSGTVVLVFSEINKSPHISVKETKKTDNIYEVTVSTRYAGTEEDAVYSFKKGDGTYIEEDTGNGNYTRLDKK